jgi:hypothetical protein
MERARSGRWEWILIGLILLCFFCVGPPILLAGREASRRTSCANNAKQLTLALQNYHETFLYLPYGARVRTRGEMPSMGASWLLSSSPFWGQQKLFDETYAVERTDDSHDFASDAVLSQTHGERLPTLHCPSSPLPRMELVQGFQLAIPSYVGMMGADPRRADSDELHTREGASYFVEERVAPGFSNGDWYSAGGMLVINDSLSFAACTDGTANTVVISEISNWYLQAGQRHRIDGSFGANWLAGTTREGMLRRGEEFSATVYNLASLRYPSGLHGDLPGAPRFEDGNSGIASDHGANNPLVSAHPAGVMAGFLDGHVLLITNQTDLIVWKRLVSRDDSGVICCDDEEYPPPKAMLSAEEELKLRKTDKSKLSIH